MSTEQQLAPSLEDVARQALDFAGDMMQQLGWARQQGDDLHRELDRDEANAYRLFNACWDALGMGPRPKPGALTERREHGFRDSSHSTTVGAGGRGSEAADEASGTNPVPPNDLTLHVPCSCCDDRSGGRRFMQHADGCGYGIAERALKTAGFEVPHRGCEERFAPVTKSAPLDAYQDERRLACDLGLCEQHGSRTPREHLVVPNGNTDTEKRAEDTECDRSVTPDHRRGRFGQEVQPRDNGVLTSTGYIAPVNADGLYREDGLEASTKTPCPDCGHFQGAHLTGEGCNRRNCDCPRTYNTPAKDGNE